MADRRGDREERDTTHRFINEKIVRQPVSKGQVVRRILLTAFCGVLFGVLAAVCFVVSAPVAQRFLGQESVEESSQITISKDDPESVQTSEEETEAAEEPSETEPVEEMIRSEIAKYHYSSDDLNKLYNNLRSVAVKADSSIVTVYSIHHDKDWFNNPIETTGRFSGAVIARTRGEILILTPYEAVKEADSIEVVFPDGTTIEGAMKQSDFVSGLAVVSVDASRMDSEQYKKVEAITLGNSYGVKQGDIVVAVGAPAGIVHSSDYGFISYVVRNVQTVDGSTRVFYTDARGDVGAGTFLLNTAGEMIGWITDKYNQEGGSSMTTVAAISDYKGVLEKLSNGIPVPYFGIRGQEVSQAMRDGGTPAGIYVTASETDSPAYNAGIQAGDILTWIHGEQVGTIKDFQNQVEKFNSGDKIKVAVQRSNGKDEYKEIEFDVTIGAR